MKMHPRYYNEKSAAIEIGEAISKIAQKHDLTEIETVRILAGQILDSCKHPLRKERHNRHACDKAADAQCSDEKCKCQKGE